jgi:N-methylhydantoinase B
MDPNKMSDENPIDSVRLEVFKHLFASVGEEMGVVLRKSSYSPNIKERRDYSCAIFDQEGNMISQASHIPVHLGSMPLSVASAIAAFQSGEGSIFKPGDVVILNDPYRGGTHLPDITLITPVFMNAEIIGYVASRAHHADVGGAAPGSMVIAREIFQEGLIIPPIKLFSEGVIQQGVLDLLLANVRTPKERTGDIWAQVAANRRGAKRMAEIFTRYGLSSTRQAMHALIAYSELMTGRLLESLPNGVFSFTDYLDDDGVTDSPVPISVSITITHDRAVVDFSGSGVQVAGSMNAVYAIALSAVNYVIRCLVGLDVPNNAGCMKPVRVIAPEGTVVNARFPAPVAGGNVETSQRIVDVLLGALAQACPERIPAASQGTMNNVTIGGWDSTRAAPFAYYETIGGGFGANPDSDGASALHSHMTNTLNTPVEALEYAYPLHVECYEIRRTGGEGAFCGGNGIRRDIKVLTGVQVSIISERRKLQPYGLAGGKPGSSGENVIIRADGEIALPGKWSGTLASGEILSIRTPGGGGFGKSTSG